MIWILFYSIDYNILLDLRILFHHSWINFEWSSFILVQWNTSFQMRSHFLPYSITGMLHGFSLERPSFMHPFTHSPSHSWGIEFCLHGLVTYINSLYSLPLRVDNDVYNSLVKNPISTIPFPISGQSSPDQAMLLKCHLVKDPWVFKCILCTKCDPQYFNNNNKDSHLLALAIQ